MKIDCYLSPECGSEEGLRENIAQASAVENIEVEVSFQRNGNGVGPSEVFDMA